MSDSTLINGVLDGDCVVVQQEGHPLNGQRVIIAYQKPGTDIKNGDKVVCEHAPHATHGDVVYSLRLLNS